VGENSSNTRVHDILEEASGIERYFFMSRLLILYGLWILGSNDRALAIRAMLGDHKCTFKTAKTSNPPSLRWTSGFKWLLLGAYPPVPEVFHISSIIHSAVERGREEGQMQSASKGNAGEGEQGMTLDRISRDCGIVYLRASRQAGVSYEENYGHPLLI
jgi:hypothetical protein